MSRSRKEPSPLKISKKALGAVKCEVWLDTDDVPYASLLRKGHREHYPVQSSAFALFFKVAYLRETRRLLKYEQAPSDATTCATQNLLCALAFEKGEKHATSIRVAHLRDSVYVDLADQSRQLVKIDREGFRIVSSNDVPEVRFLRPGGTKALPVPENADHGGNMKAVQKVLGLGETAFVQVVTFILAAFNPSNRFPILVLRGDRGSGKSTLARLVGRILDPRNPEIVSPPRNDDDLFVSARQTFLYSVDNVSGLQPWLSDAFCRLSTGGGITKRKLYSDSDVVRLSTAKPVILNGIDEIAERDDLSSRALHVKLTSSEGRRRSEREINHEFDSALPRILGSLYAMVSRSIRDVGSVDMDFEPRMYDAFEWVVAAGDLLPFDSAAVGAAYKTAGEQALQDSIDSDPLLAGLVQMLEANEKWSGSMTELRGLMGKSSKEVANLTTRALASRLERIKPVLRQLGYTVSSTGRKHPQSRQSIWDISKKVVAK